MTSTQIENILDEIGGYKTNQLIPLSEVSTIVMEGNMDLYPDPWTRFIFKIDDDVSLLEAYRVESEADGTYKQLSTIPYYVVPTKNIEAFQLVNGTRVRAPYKTGQSM